LLHCASGAIDYDGELDEIFARPQKLDPDLYSANQVRLGYLSKKEVRTEVDAASDRLLAGADQYADHPWSMAAHQVFAALYQDIPAHERARPHLERGGPRPMPWPWGYFGDEVEKFAAARKGMEAGQGCRWAGRVTRAGAASQ
jgi:hypothetical protein